GNPRPSWVPATGVPATRASRGAPRGDEQKRLSRCRLISCGRDQEGGRRKIFMDERNLPRGCALMLWNELYDPLSSFVPVLEPRPRRGFSLREIAATGRATAALLSVEIVGSRIPRPGSAGIKPCGRGRGGMEFATCCLGLSWRCPAGPFDRASRGAPAPRRPRSAGRPRGLDV